MCEAEMTCTSWPDRLLNVSQEIMKTSPNDLLIYSSGSDEDYELTNIGNEVLVPKRKLEMLLSLTTESPTRFVRGLLMLVFSKDELRGRSVTGRRRHIGGMKKDALDCGRLTAVVDYTLCAFPGTSIVKIRQTISNKLKEVNNSSSIWERVRRSICIEDDIR